MTVSVELHPDTHMGAVHLNARDAPSLARWYVAVLGLRVVASDDDTTRLAAGERVLVVLHHTPSAPTPRGTTGLYHLAILLPSRADLGRCLRHLVAAETRLSGASDHLVSEALYLSDPEGNGIEVYRDRPRAEWPLDDHGGVRMAVDPLDAEGVLAAAGTEPWAGMPPGSRMGHVHLRVADLDASEDFYRGILGFRVRARLQDSALFLAAGEYHHHLGLNTWTTVGAPPAPTGAVGLREFVVLLPDAAERDHVVDRLDRAGVATESRPDGVAVVDPSSHRLVLAIEPSVNPEVRR